MDPDMMQDNAEVQAGEAQLSVAGLSVSDLRVPGRIEGITFDIPPGQIMAVVGPSGSGKTTLVRAIAGLVKAFGDISSRGRKFSDLAPQHRPTGLVPQESVLFPQLSVAENVGFGLDDATMPEKKRADRIGIGLAEMNISGLAHTYPETLSGGQRQRVALARTLIRRPEVLLLDEPLAHVDAPSRGAMRHDIMDQVRRHRMSAIYITHDVDEACEVADLLLILKDGTMAQLDSPRAVYDRPASQFVAHSMGNPNVFVGQSLPKGTRVEKVGASQSGVQSKSEPHAAGKSESHAAGESASRAAGFAQDMGADQTIVRLGQTDVLFNGRGAGAVVVCFPPENVTLTRDSSSHVVGNKGQIIRVSFARSHMRYDVETEFGTIVASVPDVDNTFAVGDMVAFEIRRGWVIGQAEDHTCGT